jgi:hypothetical protein
MQGERRNIQVVRGQILEVSWHVPIPDVVMGCDGGEAVSDRDLRRLLKDVFGDICDSAVLEGVSG